MASESPNPSRPNASDATRRMTQQFRSNVFKLFEQAPPQATEAEMALLGSMILDPQTIGDVIGIVPNASAFYSEPHAAIYDAIVQTYDLHQTGDLVQLTESLKDQRLLEDVGGPEYLVRLAESVPSAANAPHYAKIVADKSRLRRLIDAASQIVYDAFHAGAQGPGHDAAKETIDNAEQMIFAIAEEAVTADASTLKDLLHEVMDMLENSEGRAVTGLSTGFTNLDEMTSGLQPGELIILAARPSMGKTALALNVAEQMAMYGAHGGAPAPVGVFSLEMSKQSVTQRMMCARSGVDSQRVRTNQLREEDFQQLIRASGELSEAPLYIDDTPGLTLLQLRTRARRMARRHGIRCLIIDYLQLLSAPGTGDNRQAEVSALSRGIKALARELAVPILCLSQLNRAAEQREGHRPRMSDLRESGSIEQDADVISLLHREEYYHQGDEHWADENPEKVGMTELIIAKQRNGPTGVVKLVWDGATTRFKNYAGDGYARQADAYESSYAPASAPSVSAPPAPFAPSPSPTPSAVQNAGAFGNRRKTGPAENHRDGGGSDQDFDGDTAAGMPV